MRRPAAGPRPSVPSYDGLRGAPPYLHIAGNRPWVTPAIIAIGNAPHPVRAQAVRGGRTVAGCNLPPPPRWPPERTPAAMIGARVRTIRPARSVRAGARSGAGRHRCAGSANRRCRRPGRGIHHSEAAGNAIERGVGEGQRGDVGPPGGEIGEAARAARSWSSPTYRGGIRGHHLAGRADDPGDRQGRLAGTAADIEDPQARCEPGGADQPVR